MPRNTRAAGPRTLSGLVLLACAVLAAAALIELLVTEGSAKALMATIPSVPCTNGDRGSVWPNQVRTGVRKELVPGGAIALTICGYNGMNAGQGAPQFGLIRGGGTFDRRAIGRITAQLDKLKPAHGVYSCPMDQDSDDVLTFEYATGPDVVLTVDTGGCGTIDNGHIRRLSLGVPIANEVVALSAPVLNVDWPAVVGHVRLCGGPYPGRCRTQNFDNGDRVVATNSNGLWVAMAQVGRGGRFHFGIATPGSYTFGLYAGNKLVKKLQQPVASGKTTDVVFTVAVP